MIFTLQYKNVKMTRNDIAELNCTIAASASLISAHIGHSLPLQV